MRSILFACGYYMLVAACTTTQAEPPLSAIDRLMAGNHRYTEHKLLHPGQSATRMKEVAAGQHPFAVVVSCSDSRVPPELVFDQGLGDLFVVRTAGHVLGEYELASVEYAVEHLGVKDIIVMGHENCGAISALLNSKDEELPGHLFHLVNYLWSEPEERALAASNTVNLERAIQANIDHAVRVLANDEPLLSEKFHHGSLRIYGGYYQLSNGKVRLIRE